MEQFVLGIFQEQLSKFIIGFRKEQVNANLLNGKGEITNVEVNCSFLNSHISKLTPFVELERVHISKLSFSVTSWTNLRKAPIIIDIENIEAYILEPLHYLDPSMRKSIQQVFQSQLPELLRKGLISKRGAYNLFDRILDNLTIEVRSVLVEFSTWGKFKSRRIGPWTPPKLQAKLAGIRMVSVNEYGQEASPDEVWKHNHNQHAFLIYKKIEVPDFQIYLVPQTGNGEAIPLLSGSCNKMEVQLAIKRRVKDGETLAVQLDATIPKIEVNVTAQVLPPLYSAVQGVICLLAKDRAFVDPLKQPTEENMGVNAAATTSENIANVTGPVEVTFSRSGSSVSDNGSTAVSMGEADVSVEEDLSSSSDEETAGTKSTSSSRHGASVKTPLSYSSRQQTPILPYATAKNKSDRPVIVLPLGLCIHERVSFSLSINHAAVRGTYAATPNAERHNSSFVQAMSRGFIAEMIWPKTDATKGGYLQASVGFVRVTEQFGNRVRTLLVGGAENAQNGIHSPSQKPMIARDESFPLYEERSIRPDPSGLRYTFPIQCFGMKTTIECLEKSRDGYNLSEEVIKVTHEVGIDQFDLVVDGHSYARVMQFFLNVVGGGFDTRVASGDWTGSMSHDMLLQSGVPLDLEVCIQPRKEIMLDENDFISSDLFNVTARITEMVLRIPAAISDDIRSCDILMRLGEVTFVVSSALPRTLLSGRIGSSVFGDDAIDMDAIDFPNDPSDVPYSLNSTEDPSNRQRGLQTSKPISTFRIQGTLRRTSFCLVPVISYSEDKQSQQLFCQDEFTMILCFEGERPKESNNNLTRIMILLSMEVHRLDICLDMDLLSSAAGTLISHAKDVDEAVKLFRRSSCMTNESLERNVDMSGVSEPSDKFLSRRLQVERQFNKIRESGGLTFAFCCKAMEVEVSLWRQNVQFSYPFTHYNGAHRSNSRSSQYIPLVKLVSIELKEAEVGLEVSIFCSDKRTVFKGVIAETVLCICDTTSIAAETDTDKVMAEGCEALLPRWQNSDFEVLRVGKKCDEKCTALDNYNGLTVRAEEQVDSHRVWSLAIDLGNATVDCQTEAVENLAVCLFEALLMPAWLNAAALPIACDTGTWKFPLGSIGTFLQSLSSLLAKEVDELSFSDTSGAVPEGTQRTVPATIDAMLREIIWKVVPVDVEVILMRYTGRNQVVRVPNESSNLPSFGLLLEQSELTASYLATSGLTDIRLLKVVGARGVSWQSIIQTMDQGLRHKFQSTQRIFSCSAESSQTELGATFVEPFQVGYTYGNSEVVMSLGNQIMVRQVARLDDFLTSLHAFGLRCINAKERLCLIVSACRDAATTVDDLIMPSPVEIKVEDNATSIACLVAMNSIRSAKEHIESARKEFLDYAHSLHTRLQDRDIEVARLRYQLFLKEREKMAAYTMVSSTTSSWLRIGSSQRIGQRGIMSWNLLPFWCILRKSLLFKYAGPGIFTPLDVIPLEGASLRQLAGGRKRDLKRAFAVVEKDGVVHVIVTATDREFNRWVQELSKVIEVVDYERMSMDHLDDIASESLIARHTSGTVVDEPPEYVHDAQPRQNRFAKVLQQAAKSTGQAVVERRRRKHADNTQEPGLVAQDTQDVTTKNAQQFSDEMGISTGTADSMDCVNSHLDTAASGSSPHLTRNTHSLGLPRNDAIANESQLRNRLTGMRVATKNRVETALVAAKQKGKDVSSSVRARKNVQTSSVGGQSDSKVPANFEDSAAKEWICPVCTYCNDAIYLTCEMCQTVREPLAGDEIPRTSNGGGGYQQVAVGIDKGLIIDNDSELNSESQSHLKRPMKNLFGAAVQSLRRNGQESSDGAGGHFNQRNLFDEVPLGAPEALRLRDVGLAGPLPPARYVDPISHNTSQPIDNNNTILRRLAGTWFVSAVLLFEPDVALSTAMTDAGNLAPLSGTGVAIDKNWLGQPALNVDDILLVTVSIEVFGKTFSTDCDSGCDSKPNVVLGKKVHELLSLHTKISECLSDASIYERADDGVPVPVGNAMPEGAIISCHDAVEHTGLLLSGLIRDIPSRCSRPMLSYCGKHICHSVCQTPAFDAVT
ncbi:hypothetical protein MPSEU_000931400 [Mayamaea pseudoterrestris]|nr:hypothetical protein MPSEU_000931400 [Mayamaea pseudoterrestris]